MHYLLALGRQNGLLQVVWKRNADLDREVLLLKE